MNLLFPIILSKEYSKKSKKIIKKSLERYNMYPITVSGQFTKRQKKFLKKYGFEWDGLQFIGYIPNERVVRKLKYYCQSRKLKFKINNSLGTRSGDYRRIFFIYNKPAIGNKYICAYCGRVLSKEKVTVDHLYPIGKASKSLKYQKKLNRRGVKNINEPRNLVPACKRCNMRKGAKTGIWILRGKIGRYKYVWYFRWAFRLILFIFIVYWAYRQPIIREYLETIWKLIVSFLGSK